MKGWIVVDAAGLGDHEGWGGRVPMSRSNGALGSDVREPSCCALGRRMPTSRGNDAESDGLACVSTPPYGPSFPSVSGWRASLARFHASNSSTG